MTPDDSLADVHLTIRPLPDDAPAAVRLRRWLKVGLRAFGLKCMAVEEVVNATPDFAQAASKWTEPTSAGSA